MWNSHEWAAFAQAAPKTQRPLLMQGLRNLRAGRTLEAGKDAALAGLTRGYLGMVEALIAQGPPSYSGKFAARKGCGDLLANIAAQLGRYRDEVPHTETEINAVVGPAAGAATERRFEFGMGLMDTTTSRRKSGGRCIALVDLLAELPTDPGVGCQRGRTTAL